MKIGTTFSHKHINSLGLEVNSAFGQILDFKFDIIRLGCYWNEIETGKNHFDLGKIKNLIEVAEKRGQNLIVTVGMKAPRWPEYFIPDWVKDEDIKRIEEAALGFVDKTLNELASYKSIKYWQVENEPLDKSGPEKMAINEKFLKKEVDIVRSIDNKRPILINLWGNEAKKRNTIVKAEKIGDIVGLDLYFKVPVIRHIYIGPLSSSDYYKKIIKDSSKKFWITELQAEPWEKNQLVAKDKNPPSMNAKILRENFEKAKFINPEAILLWGCEYWYWRKTQGDRALWDEVGRIMTEERVILEK